MHFQEPFDQTLQHLPGMSRGMIFSLASLMSWTNFTSDISTAFLQGNLTTRTEASMDVKSWGYLPLTPS